MQLSRGDQENHSCLPAGGDRLKLSGREVEAEFPATVYESGVLFLRVTVFRRLLRTFTGEKTITIQANEEGLMFGDVRLPLESRDMLLYPDPAQALCDRETQWPLDRLDARRSHWLRRTHATLQSSREDRP